MADRLLAQLQAPTFLLGMARLPIHKLMLELKLGHQRQHLEVLLHLQIRPSFNSRPQTGPSVNVPDGTSATSPSADSRTSFPPSADLPTTALSPMPAAGTQNLGGAPQVLAVAAVKDETLETDMLQATTVTLDDLTAPTIQRAINDKMRSKVSAWSTSGLQLQYPLRPMYTTAKDEVITNHFRIGIDDEVPLHQYKILLTLSGKSKRKIRLIIEIAIEQCAFLNDNKAKFATDYFDTIIAWTNLHEMISSSVRPRTQGDGQAIGSTWHLVTLQDGPATLSLELRYESIVDTRNLIDHSVGDVAYANTDLQPMLRALDILVSKSFDERPVETVRTGANKFFLKASRQDLTDGKKPHATVSTSLCTLRGYSYMIKPAGDCILLNVNAATSAFWKPVLLSTVFQDWATFTTEAELFKALRGVRVYIVHERGDREDTETYARLNSDRARVKPVEGFGFRFDKEEFYEEGKKDNTNVLEHFKKTYPDRKIDENTCSDPAVN
ncbi:hypothetical protein EK21DRAFT_117599 [Setomelanomma holmii]|uniref:Uncharacterized protein n=1 Tax=Setomelanomma holmii TaxID=210430 RepID=A0A9P4H017_9PLEO|nr:hypothetical protein EK21DRAFT_117599 [Setomelanomma holmii]